MIVNPTLIHNIQMRSRIIHGSNKFYFRDIIYSMSNQLLKSSAVVYLEEAEELLRKGGTERNGLIF